MNRDKTPKGSQKGEDLPFLQDGEIIYKPGDCVYVESQRPDIPYFICAIKELKKTKRDLVFVNVIWYYRPCEVPASVYQLLVQDRNTENGSSNHVLEDPVVKERELFISDAVDTYPSTALRGKCHVHAFADVKADLEEFTSQADTWFYLLRYNPESRRLANTKGEIRIGVSHQAILPDYVERNDASMKVYCAEMPETLIWRPALHDTHLMMYLRAARSITSFSGYCEEGGSPDRALHLLSEDSTTLHSLDLLHKNDYDVSQALQELVKSPLPTTVKSKWQDEERRRFSKGLRQHGKNFNKIRREMLPEKQTTELVHYYYVWKKTSFAVNSRPHKRGRRHNVLCRRNRTTKPKTAAVSEYLDLSSCSEDELDSDDSDRDLRYLYACRHCFATESPNWHHAGKGKLLVCYSCRIFFKKYGRMTTVDTGREPPPFIFKAAFENREEELLGSWTTRIRTRRSTTPISSTSSNIRNKILQEIQEARHSAVVTKKTDSPRGNSTDGSSDGGGDGGKTKSAKKRLLTDTCEDDAMHAGKKSRRAGSAEESDSESESSSTCDSPSEEGGLLENEDNNDSSPPSPCQSDLGCDSATEGTRSSSPVFVDPVIDARIASRFACIASDIHGACARSSMIYMVKRPKKEKAAAVIPHEEEIKSTAVKRESALRQEAERRQKRDHRRSPSPVSITTTPAQITSTFEAMRALMSGEHMMNPSHLPFMFAPGGVPQVMGGPHHSLNAHHHLHQHNTEAEVASSKYGSMVDMMNRHAGRFSHVHGDHGGHGSPMHHPHSVLAGGQHPLDPMARLSPRQGIDMMPLGGQHPHVHSHMHTHTHLHVHPNDAHGGHYGRDPHGPSPMPPGLPRGSIDPLKLEGSPYVRHADMYHHLTDGHYRGPLSQGGGSLSREGVISPSHAHDLASMRGHGDSSVAAQQMWLAQVAARQQQSHSQAQQQQQQQQPHHFAPDSGFYQSAAGVNPMRLSSDCDEYFRYLRSLGAGGKQKSSDFGMHDRHHHMMDARMAAACSNYHHGDPLRRIVRDGNKPVTIDLCEE